MRPFTTWSFEHLISGFNQPTTLRLSSRHCERSEAIHSSFARRDGLLRFARNDVGLQTRIRIPRRDAPEAFHEISRPSEGVGNAGCPWHPRPRVHLEW